MSKHRRTTVITRRIVAASAAAATVGVLTPGIASAAGVVVPNTDIQANIEGIENVPGIENIPGVEQFIPSLAATEAPAVIPAAAPVAAPAPAPAPAPAAAPSTGQQIVDAARSRIGSPYVYGATGPSTFDCSGLTTWAYSQAGKSIPRTSQAQASAGQNVSPDNLQPGDIIVYYSGASHVAIYSGNGMMIDALNSGSTVTERPINYMPIHSAVRF